MSIGGERTGREERGAAPIIDIPSGASYEVAFWRTNCIAARHFDIHWGSRDFEYVPIPAGRPGTPG